MVRVTHSLLLCCSLCAVAYSAVAAAGAAPTGGPKLPVIVEPFVPTPIAAPDHVIGTGAPESITEDALQKAMHAGGTIVFNTGGAPVTLKLTKTLQLPGGAKPTIIDGMGLVTLDGGGKVRIIQKEWKTELTVQRLHFQHARAEKDGAGIWNTNWEGRTTVIDCQFEDCKTTAIGPDIGGGAIRVTGQKHLVVSGCTFEDCEGSNGGAICTIGCQMTIVNCTFRKCHAFGMGGGAERGPNGQGGIGGAVYIDGVSQNADKKQLYLGNCLFQDNRAGDHAGAIFGYTVPKQGSVCIYYNSIFENNTVDEPKQNGVGFAGAVYSQFCNLHVINCSFGNNKCPKIGGALFLSTLDSTEITNCEFYGNSPEFKAPAGSENVTMTKRDVSPAVIALGRMPGAPPVHAEHPKTVAEPKPAAVHAAPKVDARVLSGYDAKLHAALKQTLASGKKLKAFIHLVENDSAPKEYPIDGCDDTDLQVSVDGNRMPLKWAWLSVKDRSALAIALSRLDSEDPAPLILAGVFYSASGQTSEAAEVFAKAGVKDAAGAAEARKAVGLVE